MKLYTTIALFFILIASGCGSQKATSKRSLPKQQRVLFEKAYFEGAKQKAINNKDKAIDYFLKAVSIDDKSHEAMYQLGDLYFERGELVESLVWSEMAVESNPDFNHWYYRQLAFLYRSNGMYLSSAETFEKMTDFEPKEEDNYIEASNQYLNYGDPDKAVVVLKKMQTNLGISEEASRRLSFIYNRLDKPELAEDVLLKLIEESPDNAESYEYLAEHYLNNEDFDKSEEAIQKIIKIEDDETGYPYMMLYTIKDAQGDDEKAFEYLKKGFSYADVPIEAKMQSVGELFLKSKKEPENLDLLEDLAMDLKETHRNEAEPFIFHADVNIQKKDFDKARGNIKSALELDKSDFLIWTKLLFVDSKLEDKTKILADSKEALELFPSVNSFYVARANAFIDNDMFDKAIEVSDEGLEIALEKPDKISLLTTIASAHEGKKNYKAADVNYKKALKLNPYNPVALNNYAFSLADRNDELTKADSLIDLAMKMDKGNPNFMDTKGWVAFRMGESNEAIEWLEKGIGIDPNIAEIYEHLIEVYKANGDSENQKKTEDNLEKLNNESP